MAADRIRRGRRARPVGGETVGEPVLASPGPLTRPVQIGLLALSAASLVAAVLVGAQRQADAHRLQDYIACQAGVNEAMALAQRSRSEATDQDRAADRAETTAARTLIVTVFTATGPDARSKILAAFATYDRALKDVDASRAGAERQRREHPLPPLPSETCR